MKNASHTYPADHSGVARKLRKTATPAERFLWKAFQQLRLQSNIRFRRQQPIGPYIVDFYCSDLACVVEIDGMSHDSRKSSDDMRDDFMVQRGLNVFRFTEKETLENVEGVIECILRGVGREPHPPAPPSRGGVK